ncbi:hypothetical protein [Virgibacillus dokdonensis]|uniref:Uncharacterized protein n=1 Tax=Virgibacillus dokdonensis TaxID=302167 RepID=A0A2K9IZL3_9BACI|nr:hypothetical protein [Virgibacillus dokdonensis]AUJ25148.1 hypothetical protein A21D_02084 [Virgibacillus dokdonensis]
MANNNGNVVNIESNNKYQGKRVPYLANHGILEEKSRLYYELLESFQETAASHDSNQKEGLNMDTSVKGYIDDRFNSLEKSINNRIASQEKLLSEKIDHLHTKNEKTITDSMAKFKETFEKDRKEDKKFLLTTAISIAAVAVAILGFVF